MRSVLLLALVACAFAADNVVNYAGTTNNSAPFNFPVFTSGACAASSSQAPYVMFQFNVTAAGVRSIQVMAENTFKSYVSVYLYNTFTASTPCVGNFINRDLVKKSGLSGGPVIDDVVYFPVGTYTAVVSSDSADVSGIFAIQIAPPSGFGTITPASTTWAPAYTSSGACTTSGSGVPFGTFQWTANMTGNYDFILGVNNETDSWSYTYLDVYTGALDAATIAAAPCAAAWLAGDYDSDDIVGLFNVSVTTGITYTFAVSGDYSYDLGYWGVWVRPTQVRSLMIAPAPQYTQPERGTYPCTASTGTSPWWALQFKAIGQVTVIDTSSPPSQFQYVDTYSFLYYGNNAGSASAAPESCPAGKPLLVMGDTGDVTPVYSVTSTGRNYTAVVSTYSASNTAGGEFVLYTFSGKPLGIIPAPPGVMTSEATSEPEATSSSDASVVAVASFVVLAAVAALF